MLMRPQMLKAKLLKNKFFVKAQTNPKSLYLFPGVL